MTSVESWLATQRSHVRVSLFTAVGLSFGSGLLLIVQAYLMALIVDSVIFLGADLDSLWPFLWGLLAVFVVRSTLVFFTERAAFETAVTVKTRAREALFRRLQALGPLHASDVGAGTLASLVMEGIEALEDFYARYLPDAALAALVPAAFFVVVLPRDWFSAVVFLSTAPLIPLFMILIGKGAEHLNRRQWRKLAHLGGRLLDAIQGLTTLKILNATRREAGVIAQISDEYRRSTMSVLRVAFLSSMVLEFFASVSIAVVAVFIGFRLVGYLEWGTIDFRTGFFVLLLAPDFYRPLRNLGTRYHARLDAIGAAEGLVKYLEQPTPERDRAIHPIPDGPGFSIDFDQVSLSYSSGVSSLHMLTLNVTPGERLALVGPSGAGKSSVFNLLLRFADPESGSIRINGVDLEKIELDEWRRHIAWMPQRPHIFHGTLRDNVTLGFSDARQSDVDDAIEMAGASEFVSRLPDGLDTVVGERGQGLSGGQIQRIALARAFLRDAPLLLLDEATASLDEAAESGIGEAVDRLADGRTVLIIAHRLRTVRSADRIVVLDKGRIVESGIHDNLLHDNGLYAALAGHSRNRS